MAPLFLHLLWLIPLAVGYKFLRGRLPHWTMLIGFTVGFIITIIVYQVNFNQQTKDYEHYQYLISKVELFEEWDEWISQQCPYQCNCQTRTVGKTTTTTCQTCYRDCSYRKYHPEHYVAIADYVFKGKNRQKKFEISKESFVNLRKRFATKPLEIDLNRDYYKIDGDKWVVKWDGSEKSFCDWVERHTYVNRTQASDNIIGYSDVTVKNIKKYRLYGYQNHSGFYDDPIYGDFDGQFKHASRTLAYINALYGSKYEFRCHILLFKTDKRAGKLQEALWKGGNKNELNICIGINDDYEVQWARPFSWSKKHYLEVEVRDLILNQKKLNLLQVVKYLQKEVPRKWKRREFKEFEYLEVGIPVWIHVMASLFSIALAIAGQAIVEQHYQH